MNSDVFMLQQKYTAGVEQALRRYMENAKIPETLQKCMAYSLLSGGKRLRPTLLLASCEMLGGTVADAMPFAAAIEMIHCYSLIHDDLPAMDNDDMRRGKPTCHKVFGEGMAILAGDGLLSYAVQIMADTCGSEEPGRLLAMRAVLLGAGVSGMVAGQCLDLENENNPKRDEATLLAIHAGKTGAMLTAAVTAGAYAANAKPEEVTALERFGRWYGLLFQITDDILDVEGDSALVGKTLGKDAAEGKLTYPLLYGLDASKRKAQEAAAKAQEAIAGFGAGAALLHAITVQTLTRNH